MNTSPLRRCVVLVIVLLVASGGVVAVAGPRDRPADTSPPVTVYVGETLDVSNVELTGGGTVGTSGVTLVGTAGDADGTSRYVDDPTDADFGTFATGAYRVASDADERADVSVVEPRVTRVVVRNQNGANVTNGWEPTGESLTVTADYNFAEADRLDVTVRDPTGVDVTPAVTTSDRITTSGGSVQLDLSDEDEGTFRIVLEGSDLEDARLVVTVRTGPRRTATPLPATPEHPASTPTGTSTATPEPTETPSPTATSTATPEPPEPTATETPTTTPDPTETPTPAPGTTTTSTPGFGLSVAVVALALWLVRIATTRRR